MATRRESSDEASQNLRAYMFMRVHVYVYGRMQYIHEQHELISDVYMLTNIFAEALPSTFEADATQLRILELSFDSPSGAPKWRQLGNVAPRS